ncbi:MAG: hypothetical protein F4X42_11850, partial [Rhodospirillaceae bacterium]|nr:hypothetical protein [Rhodospirillaceae bacterium]
MTEGVCRDRGILCLIVLPVSLYSRIEHLSNNRTPAMTAPLSPATPDSLPGALPTAAPEAHPPDAAVPESPLTLRQEDFCRHYAASGNAAGAARDAGYAAGSAR